MTEPEVLGARYEVLRTVSAGRRASVLQALDRVHDQLVALKVYELVDDERDEVLAEAELLMSVAPHRALPVVRGDFFTDDGRYVLVMNWVDGTDLQHVLEDYGDPGLPLVEVIGYLEQVASALDHLHSHEPAVVHGDVKPGNLVRTANGNVVLVDFDIAGAHAGKGRVGTVGYVAPEVMAGEKPGPAADVFGLAATAVTLLNGAPATDGTPTYPGVDAVEQAQLARVLRSALAVDPVRRPRSASRLVENLRRASRGDHPSGVVALLATEVADAGHYWSEDPDEMRVAMRRLRDVGDEVVDTGGGRVVTSMNEGDRVIAVFREASAAATAALTLHDRLAREPFPPGIQVRLRAAIAVGEATVVDGVYSGAVVDNVVQLRSNAGAGTTIASESTAELLVGLVGRDVSIVSLGELPIPDDIDSARVGGVRPKVFALTRPGAEHTAELRSQPAAPTVVPSWPLPDAVGSVVPRRAVVVDAMQHPTTLVSVTAAGFALIYLVVLSPELGMSTLAALVLFVGLLGAVMSFSLRYSMQSAAHRDQIATRQRELDDEATAQAVTRERAETRNRLERGFGGLDSTHGDEGTRVLQGLAGESDAIAELLRRSRERPSISLSALLPDLADETYRYGMSALSDALELFEFADGPQSRRLEAELRDVTERLALDNYVDERARARDKQRGTSHRQLLAHHEESRQRACDLMFEAERCTAALAEARLELSSVRAGDTRVDVDAVVETLQETIRRVRDVQTEMRRMGY